MSPQAMDDANIKKGENKPVCIEVKLANSAGIFQMDKLLRIFTGIPLFPEIQCIFFF